MRIFIAGATGATGQVLLPLATAAGHDVRFHIRPQTAPKTPLARDPRAYILDLDQQAELIAALEGVESVFCLIGTMRKRFAQGDTYESSDIGATQHLLDAAKAAHVPQFILLSSFGAGGLGAYMQMKGKVEDMVKTSGMSWVIFQPSALESPPDGLAGHHGRREVPGFVSALGRGLRALPGARGFADDWRPMPLDVLARAMLRGLLLDDVVLTGRHIWEMGA